MPALVFRNQWKFSSQWKENSSCNSKLLSKLDVSEPQFSSVKWGLYEIHQEAQARNSYEK